MPPYASGAICCYFFDYNRHRAKCNFRPAVILCLLRIRTIQSLAGQINRWNSNYIGEFMKIAIFKPVLLAFLIAAAHPAMAESLSDISNYRDYTETFSSSGQPTAEQLELLNAEGFERIIYLAFTTSSTAIAKEDEIVRELGMEYIHVPVVWEKPTASDFYTFVALMQREPEKKTLLHCQVNFRASSFSFLYRVLYQDVPMDDAKADLDTVWQPDEIWQELIFSILQENGKSPHCDFCTWDAGK